MELERRELCDKIYYMAKKKVPFLEICKRLELKDYEIIGFYLQQVLFGNFNRENNKTLTENGALAYSSTGNSLLDLFGSIGALRTRSVADINGKFMSAFLEDKLLAMKMLFYARNIRGGLGERRTFRTICAFLADNYPSIMQKNLLLVPFFGRWDDMYAFGEELKASDPDAYMALTTVDFEINGVLSIIPIFCRLSQNLENHFKMCYCNITITIIDSYIRQLY